MIIFTVHLAEGSDVPACVWAGGVNSHKHSAPPPKKKCFQPPSAGEDLPNQHLSTCFFSFALRFHFKSSWLQNCARACVFCDLQRRRWTCVGGLGNSVCGMDSKKHIEMWKYFHVKFLCDVRRVFDWWLKKKMKIKA